MNILCFLLFSGGYDSVALAPLYEGPPQRYDFGAGLVFVDRCGAAAFSGELCRWCRADVVLCFICSFRVVYGLSFM